MAPQVSPLLSNLLLTPFDREMRRRGYQLTHYADDWVVTCRTRQEAERVLLVAEKVLTTLGVTLNREKTRIVHVRHGFEFLGYKIKRGERPLHLPAHKITSGAKSYSLYAESLVEEPSAGDPHAGFCGGWVPARAPFYPDALSTRPGTGPKVRGLCV
jgi:hypothetical protein